MRLSILAIAVAILAGCGSLTRINPGAELPIYVASAQWMHSELPPGADRATSYLRGKYRPSDGAIILNEQLPPWQMVKTFTHELAHAYDHQRPTCMWVLLRRYESPAFSFNFHGDEEHARLKAIAASLPPPTPEKP